MSGAGGTGDSDGRTFRPDRVIEDETNPGVHVAVIILHWGPVEVTMRCLRSLARASFSGRMTVLLIDNAQSGERALGDCAPGLDIEIHRPDGNLGFAAGCNWGMSLARGLKPDFILLLNNDAVIEPSLLDHLVRAASTSPHVGLACPRIVSMTDPARPWYVGGSFSLWSGIPVQTDGARTAMMGEPREVDYATGCAMLINPAVLRSIGSFDPRFFAYCEDLDFSLRARRAGFRILMVPAALTYHAVNTDPARRSLSIYYSTRNLLEVMRRHAAWYHWPSFTANFLVRWVGFFTALACVRCRPQFVRALASGAFDFLRGKLGERSTASRTRRGEDREAAPVR